MITNNEKRLLEQLKGRLKPPTNEELDHITAEWLFGRNAEKMLKFAPWSFLLLKLMWKKGEEPWES
ncbi:MAG: hypothetical protein KAH97_09705 [Anaerolineales bacterium]|nr:hypothetical protein [Anaerolineales bacterium]